TRPPHKSTNRKRPASSVFPVLHSSPPRLSYDNPLPAVSSPPGVGQFPHTLQFQAASTYQRTSTDIVLSSPTLTRNMDPFEEVSDDENEHKQTETPMGPLSFKTL